MSCVDENQTLKNSDDGIKNDSIMYLKLCPLRVDEKFFNALFWVRAFSICLLLSSTAAAQPSRDRSVLFSDSSRIVCLFFKLLCS